jgi:hypothetical protein
MIKRQSVRDGAMTNAEVTPGRASAGARYRRAEEPDFFHSLKKGWRRSRCIFNKRYKARGTRTGESLTILGKSPNHKNIGCTVGPKFRPVLLVRIISERWLNGLKIILAIDPILARKVVLNVLLLPKSHVVGNTNVANPQVP